MPLLRTLRYQQQRHTSCMRGIMLLVLLSVAAAGIPQWIVHAHTADHGSALVVGMDGHGLNAHDVASDDPLDPPMGDAQTHGHCLGAFSTLLPSTLMGVPCRAPQVDRGPSDLTSLLCKGHLTTLHRPPIV